jgi:hypothetical protein
MANNIKIKRSSVAGKIPTVEQMELGELAINTHDGKIFLKTQVPGTPDPVEAVVSFVSKVPVGNTIFLSVNGNNSNDGSSWDESVSTLEKAIELAQARNGELTLIDIGPGEYITQGHLDMPDNSMIRSVHRSVIIKPETGYEERNVLRLGSGCFVEGPVFDGWRLDDLDNPTEGFAISFRPGAVITRVPYAHKIVVRSARTWDYIAPPLDRENANPLVGVGAGVVLADGKVCSPNSIYPNIMTWGATPVSHNGIGYCAKNGALINAVNAISIWAHKHFVALSGGQLILSSCSTQFGDYTLVSSGGRHLIYPTEVADGSSFNTLSVQTTAAAAIITAKNTIIDDLWDALVAENYTTDWTEADEAFTRRDAENFLQSMSWVLQTANEKPMLDFARGLFDVDGTKVYDSGKESAFIFSFEFMRDEIKALADVNSDSDDIVDALVAALLSTINTPVLRFEPSTITAISHTWTAIFAGVALTKIPPARNFASIEESIQEFNGGIVIASGQDDQGSALFIGGMKIDADTGELSGPPFEQAVNRIATRTAIARSF